MKKSYWIIGAIVVIAGGVLTPFLRGPTQDAAQNICTCLYVLENSQESCVSKSGATVAAATRTVTLGNLVSQYESPQRGCRP